MKLTRAEKKEVVELLADEIEAQTGTDLSSICGDGEAKIGAVQDFMGEVARWLLENHPATKKPKQPCGCYLDNDQPVLCRKHAPKTLTK